MGALTEREIFDQMATSFRLAIEDCDALAAAPVDGVTYDRFRKQLRLIEGCAKQANTWREDTRWLVFIRLTSGCHQRAGDWLRGIKDPMTGLRTKIAPGTLHPAFEMLAANLRELQKLMIRMRDAATGRVGMILPEPLAGPHRDTRPAGWRAPPPNLTPGGLLLPDGMRLQ
jgi:hypothetical protein